ncbi:MAG: NAD(P)-dependent oxidoreductase [Pirellulales bacterium]
MNHDQSDTGADADTDTRNHVGVVGLGLLGTAICERLLSEGFTLSGYDVAAPCRRNAESLGVRTVENVPDVARRCRRIVLCLPDSDVVARVADELLTQLRPDSTVIDTTTGTPAAATTLGERLAAQGCGFLEANVVGSSDHMRRHDAVLLVGGPSDDVARRGDLLAALGREFFHVGGWGDGGRMKLVVNLVLGLNRAVLAEGLSFAAASGLDQQAALDVLSAGLAYSRVMDVKGPKMLAGEYSPQARLSQHLKDVRLILASGCANGASLPLSAVHEQLLVRATELGFADADNSAVFEAFRHGDKP